MQFVVNTGQFAGLIFESHSHSDGYLTNAEYTGKRRFDDRENVVCI